MLGGTVDTSSVIHDWIGAVERLTLRRPRSAANRRLNMAEDNDMRQVAATLIMAHQIGGDKSPIEGAVARILKTSADIGWLEKLANEMLADKETAESLAEVIESRLYDPDLGKGLSQAEISSLKKELRQSLHWLNKKIEYLNQGYSAEFVKELELDGRGL